MTAEYCVSGQQQLLAAHQMSKTVPRLYCTVIKDTSFMGRTNAFHDLVEKADIDEV